MSKPILNQYKLVKNRALKREFEDKRNKDINTKQNNEVLSKQLEEKRLARVNEKEQQALIAKQYQAEVNKIRQEELTERANKHKRQEEYYNQLNTQLRDKHKRKKYSVLMSEHERSVNDNDIKAYQKTDTSTLSAKIPGFKISNPQEKYIDKSMNVDADAAKLYGKLNPVPTIEKPKCIYKLSASLDTSKSSPRRKNNMLQNAALKSFENFGMEKV